MRNNDDMDKHYRVAESEFYRIKTQKPDNYPQIIDNVEYIQNHLIIEKFKKKKKEFENKYANEEETESFLAFYQILKDDNVECILADNFKASSGKVIGFTEFPKVDEQTNCLLLCKILQGSEMQGDCRKEEAGTNGSDGWSILIQNVEQIIPCYVIHLKTQSVVGPIKRRPAPPPKHSKTSKPNTAKPKNSTLVKPTT